MNRGLGDAPVKLGLSPVVPGHKKPAALWVAGGMQRPRSAEGLSGADPLLQIRQYYRFFIMPIGLFFQ